MDTSSDSESEDQYDLLGTKAKEAEEEMKKSDGDVLAGINDP